METSKKSKTTKADKEASLEEQIIQMPISKISDFPNHPFKVQQDVSMSEMAESIKKYGVLHPALVRVITDGSYELIAGHRRKMACMLAGIETMPVIVRKLSDDEAVIAMVDSNCQREQLLPSEKAKAYQMKLEAIKRQGERSDLTCVQVEHKLIDKKSRDIIGEQTGDSGPQISRYIRLNELIPEILDMVDEKKIAFNPAVELSYLPQELQQELYDCMEAYDCTPSLSQAQRLKKASQSGKLDKNGIELVLSEEKPQQNKLTLKSETLKKFFPQNYTPKQMEEVIVKLLSVWQRKRQHER